MIKSDDFNLVLAESVDTVDRINAKFYGQFPYPWRAVKFDYLQDPYFEAAMLQQDIGDWGHSTLPRSPRIWVAGCGTNQAVFTALRFPKATVVGSDLSDSSLDICSGTAKALGVRNLELRRESINHAPYREEFDYVISTGVIHHNADPRAALERISAALKPSGVLELMVYNRFHWTIPAAFQKAMRILGGDSPEVDFGSELEIAKKIIGELPQDTLIGVVAKYRDYSDAMLADELLQPVLHHYTVESLSEMADSCGLEITLPCLNQFDKAEGRYTWDIEFKDPALRDLYQSLPDLRRWQVTNLLLRDNSPWLWFYMQRRDSGRARKSEREVCEEFLEQKFVRAQTTQRGFIQSGEDGYKLLPNALGYPHAAPDPSVRKIVEAADGQSTMREIFGRLGLETSFAAVNRARVMLTTPLFPFLKSAPAAGKVESYLEVRLAEGEKKRRGEEKLKKFKSVRPVAVNLTRAGVVKTSPLRPGATLPLVIEPEGPGVDLADWAASNRSVLEAHLSEHGALLARGFGVESPAQLERFARALCDDLLTDNGEHRRSAVSGGVYTPVFYPAGQQLLWHNENTFNHRWPSKIWFCCVRPAARGGETPVVDSRRVYEAIDPRVRERFVERGVMYVRNYGTGLGLGWREVFATDSRPEVERKCREARMEFRWKGDDQLMTSCVRPAVVKHPRTGEASWFNQAQHWHVSCLDEATRESTRKLFSEEDMPRNCYYGDGTPIADEEMDSILDVYRRLEVGFAWERGDVMLVDNILAAHGRNSFEGERELLVTMGGMLTYDDV
jgi:SAM-dependent methyltransferase/alpha-ketoglutarate-dependent taurine dioxygenase